MICKTAEQRYKVLCFWEKHGLAASQEAFGVSRRTLYAWRKQLRQGGGKPHAIAPQSTRPKRLRHRRWPAAVIGEIRRLRRARPNLGKEKLRPFLQTFCQREQLPCPGTRTIGRSIADAPGKMRLVPQRASPRFGKVGVKSPRQRKPKGYRAEAPGDCLAWDSIERRRDGLKRHLITCTDLKSRFAFALGINHLSSGQAKLALDLAQIVFPLPVRRILSDNGSEFAKHFHQSLCDQGLTHWHTYPRTPKMNAHVERFNRTIQDELVDYHEDLLFGDLNVFNDKLFDWLYRYNAQRPHHRLGPQNSTRDTGRSSGQRVQNVLAQYIALTSIWASTRIRGLLSRRGTQAVNGIRL
jgi:transposase InsO family protein